MSLVMVENRANRTVSFFAPHRFYKYFGTMDMLFKTPSVMAKAREACPDTHKLEFDKHIKRWRTK